MGHLYLYEEINVLSAFFPTQYYPNTKSVAGKLSSNPVCVHQLINYAKACVQSAYRYFNEKFGDDLKHTVEAIKYTKLFDPAKIYELQPSKKGLLSSVLTISCMC